MTTFAPQTTAPVAPTSPTPTSISDQAASTLPPSTEECGTPAIEIAIGSPISEAVDNEQPDRGRFYFCVDVPGDVTGLTFELAGLTDNLELFVGYPDLATLQNGGLTFWSSHESGTDQERVVVEPALVRGDLGAFEQRDFVTPGPYYIEVSGVSSPFTLSVTTP